MLAVIIAGVATAFAANLEVSPSNLGQASLAVTANDLKPAACSALYLTNIISGSGTLTGSSGNDLIVGASGADLIDGVGGDDCILAGEGDDTITGGDGNDICLGGPGTDTFSTCEGEGQ